MSTLINTKPLFLDPRKIKEDHKQQRKVRDPEAYGLLVESVRTHGVLQAPGILQDYTIVFGWSRVCAAIEAGLDEIPVTYVTPDTAKGGPAVLAFVENALRSNLTQQDTLLALEGIHRENPEWKQKQIAATVGMQESLVSLYLKVGRNAVTREPFLAGKFNLAIAGQIASAEPDAQVGLLNMTLAGPVTRETIAAARRARPQPTDGPKMSKVVCPLPSGAKVTVSCENLTLEGFIEVLTQAIDSAKKAIKEDLDVKTATQVWSCKSQPKSDK